MRDEKIQMTHRLIAILETFSIFHISSFILAKNGHPQTTPLLALSGDEENKTLRGSTPVPWLNQGTFEIYCYWLPVAILLVQACGLALFPHRWKLNFSVLLRFVAKKSNC